MVKIEKKNIFGKNWGKINFEKNCEEFEKKNSENDEFDKNRVPKSI